MESIQGLVEHIVYHNDTNGYTVFSMMCQGEEIVCVGTATSLDEGEYLKAEGEYIEHQVYGRQFKVSTMSVEIPEDEYSIERYLGSGAIKGVGPSSFNLNAENGRLLLKRLNFTLSVSSSAFMA